MKPVGKDLDHLAAEIGVDRAHLAQMVECVMQALRPLSRGDRLFLMTVVKIRTGIDIEREDPSAQNKLLAAGIAREIEARALELRASGARAPTTRAQKEIAERLGHASGAALNRWLRRNR